MAKPASPEKTENMVALAVFAVLLLVVIALFTNGFGLFKPSELNERVSVPIGNDPVRGNLSGAKVVVVVFSDFECPLCARAELFLADARARYGQDIAFVFKNFPLTAIHPSSMGASLASECANEQGRFWDYHDKLFANQQALDSASLKGYAQELGLDEQRFNECLDSQRYLYEVGEDQAEGRSLGISGTPTFFINGVPLVGAREEEFNQIVQQELS